MEREYFTFPSLLLDAGRAIPMMSNFFKLNSPNITEDTPLLLYL